ncbi:MAG: ABC transporter ATP-binding protein [Parvibaculaceae bacterium]
MGRLEVLSITVTYGDYRALDDVSFEVSDGERLCLLGPSGCGKTTSLRVVAGFIRPDAGEVRLAGHGLTGQPPERRNIGILFQNYALFPHLTIYDNIAFGLRMRSMPEATVRQKVTDALSLVRLSSAAGKKPAQLSGGEQQRIAFARAVVIEPSLLLLDEPFSNLDARLRQEMRGELLDLLKPLKIATVMVTHDQEEAMAIADRIAVMNRGRIEQVGTPSEIYDRPRTPFVAHFVGESNLLSGTARRNGSATLVEVPGMGAIAVTSASPFEGAVKALIRPEKIRVLDAPGAARDSHERVTGTIERMQYLGHRTQFDVKVGEQTFSAWSLNERPASGKAGDSVVLEWPRDGVVLFQGGAGS